LVLALRLAVGQGGTVALPGFGCVDLASAVRFAGVKVRLYDIDPATMSPDLDSLEDALGRGVQAVVVAHYYGYPADIPGVRALARAYGVPLIEDAAQAAGGTLRGLRLGALGDICILSFGRGKGLFGGRGGALLGFAPEFTPGVASHSPSLPRRGAGDLAVATAQWLLGRPGIYALPASIPWLHLGEMIYHPAHEPAALSPVAATLVHASLAAEASDRATRRRNAAALHAVTEGGGGQIAAIRPIPGAEPGFLRFAVLDRSGARDAAPRLGVMRGYPRTLHEQPELREYLAAGEPPTPGAAELRATLFTLPVHLKVTDRDLADLRDWIRPFKNEVATQSVASRRDAATPHCGHIATNRYATRHAADPAERGCACGTRSSVESDGVPAFCECAEIRDSAGRDHHL
jgi:dTDP-4-amino-4,6-dideoxygalactose transaminase